MDIRRFLKARVWLPAALGIAIGLVLFLLGENDDAPGLVLVGFVAAIILVFYGAYNAASEVKKGFVPAMLCFLLSALGAFWAIVLAVEGEFADSPGILLFVGLICLGLLVVGLRLLKRWKERF